MHFSHTIRLFCTCLILAVFAGCQSSPDPDQILSSTFEEKMISSGSNRPQIALWKDHRKEILELLHYRVPPEKIRAFFGWTQEEWNKRLSLLRENDFVRTGPSGEVLPTTMVITLDEGNELHSSAKRIAPHVVDYLEQHRGMIEETYRQIPAFRDGGGTAAYFVLSDVLMDNWQINAVERQFIGAERTLRHGMHYYHSIQEKDSTSPLEAFGIYGNQMWRKGDFLVGVYGNRRSSTRHLISLSDSDLTTLFGMKPGGDASEFRESLLSQLVAAASGSHAPLPQGIRNGLEELGLYDGGKLGVFVLSTDDDKKLDSLASLHTAEIVRILGDSKAELRKDYDRSRYAEEISFDEYLIWWYHFLYSEVTDMLEARSVIQIPSNGLITYIVDLSEHR